MEAQKPHRVTSILSVSAGIHTAQDLIITALCGIGRQAPGYTESGSMDSSEFADSPDPFSSKDLPDSTDSPDSFYVLYMILLIHLNHPIHLTHLIHLFILTPSTPQVCETRLTAH